MSLRSRLTRRPPMRVRLALWSTGGLLVVLVVVGLAMTIGLETGLRDRAHESLEVPFRVVAHQLSTQPGLRLADLLETTPEGERQDELIGQLLDGAGAVVDSTGQPPATTPMVGPTELAAATRDGEWHEPRRLPGRATDDIVVVVPLRSGLRAGSYVVLAQSLARTQSEVDRLIRLYAILGPVVLLTSLLGSWWIVRSALRPVDALTSQAAVIDPALTDDTLPVPAGDDEISRLAQALNEMLLRLRHAIDRERRFSADASHELRTPLALMTTALDVELRSPTTPDSARPLLSSLREDASRLSHTVEDLLVLSRSDASGQVELAVAEEDLLDLTVTVAGRFRAAAGAKGIVLAVDGAPVLVPVDAQLLGQALANLVDNALKYSGEGTVIEITVQEDPDPQIIVADQGIGIPTDQLPHVFDRFYRVDPARGAGGSGLGLAIVRSIVQAHGGTIEVQSEPGQGARFTIRLPPRDTPVAQGRALS